MDFTGERLVLGKKGLRQLEIEHLHRYWIVRELVKGKIVLDIACGSGYGANFLANSAKKVYGVDISEEAIVYCKGNYQRDNLIFEQGSVTKIPLEDHSVDVIISFETVEHVDEVSQQVFLKEIKRVLKKDGLLVMSTPDKYVYSDIPNYHNEYHTKEFYENEFRDYLAKEFINIKLIKQGMQISSVICESQNEYQQVNLFETQDKNYYPYLIALCSDEQLIFPGLNSLYLDKDNLLYLLNNKYNTLNRIFAEKDIENMQKQIIEQKEDYIQEQREELEERRKIIEQKENYIQEQREELEERRKIIEQKEDYIQEQRGELEEYRKVVEQKEDYIQEQREELEECRKIIEQKDNYIEYLRVKNSEIVEEIESFKTSKIYKAYNRIKQLKINKG